MGPVTSIAAGFAAAIGAVTLFRMLRRRASASDAKAHDDPSRLDTPRVLEYELDPASGIYRPR